MPAAATCPPDALLLVAHGARAAGWDAPFRAIERTLRAATPLPLVLAFIEHQAPSVDAALDALVANHGARHIALVPLLLGAGSHARADLPRAAAAACERHPGLAVLLGEVAGDAPAVQQALADYALGFARLGPLREAPPLPPAPPYPLAALNAVPAPEFTAALGGVVEHSPWVAEAVAAQRPFASVDALAAAFAEVLAAAPFARQLAVLRAHPQLASKAAVRRELTAHSNAEQQGAGLTDCTPEEFAELTRLNDAYQARFGWPFILAVKGYDRAGVLAQMARRLQADAASEFAECIAQVGRIAALRLAQAVPDGAG